MHLVAGCRGAMNGLLAEVIEDHVREHLIDRRKGADAPLDDAIEQLVDVVHSYSGERTGHER